MKVVSININGIRSACSKGLFEFLHELAADVICLQEVRSSNDNIYNKHKELITLSGYDFYFSLGDKAGYSGVAIYSKIKPQQILRTPFVKNFRDSSDIALLATEGRYLELQFTNLKVVSLYLPSGTSGEERQQIKFTLLKAYYAVLAQEMMGDQSKTQQDIIICGDFNIAHNNIDLKNWRANQKHSGFLDEERQWLSSVLALGYVDVWRSLYKNIAGYTWWSNRGRAYAKDVGWRIDYQLCSPKIAALALNAYVYKDKKFSDHAPLVVNYDYQLK